MTTPQAALVEALREAEDYLRNCANSPALADKCRAALAQAEAAQPVYVLRLGAILKAPNA